MTAVIGILNKEGAAVAADSAVTMRRGRHEKISNSANKMVRLSDAQPISAIIFSSADFMQIPWDIIIRWYRHQRGGLEFPTLKDHVNDFLTFIVQEHFFCTEEQNKRYLSMLFEGFFNEADQDTPFLNTDMDGNPENLEEAIEGYRAVFQARMEACRDKGICPSFKDYTLDSFKAYAAEIVDGYLQNRMHEDLYLAVREDVLESFYYEVIHRNEDMTGLVFTGYGRDDKYPSSLCVRVVLGFDGHLASYVLPEDDVTISDGRPYAVLPYAQTDVMKTLVNGVDPRLDLNLGDLVGGALESFRDEAEWNIRSSGLPEEAADAMAEVPYEDLEEAFSHALSAHVKKFRNRAVFDGVENLPVREMARLAEEMVSITAVKRHINFDDEGVGGLVDLAVITRDKGFTWLNRKGWYDTPGEDGFKI